MAWTFGDVGDTMSCMQVTSEEQLRAIVGYPGQLPANKVRSRLQQVHREWLAASPFLLLATTDADGRIDVSPKGDPPGKVIHIIDDSTIAIPERPGNRRVDGYLNVLSNPRAGTLAMVPGRGDTLRINGGARIVDDAPYFDELSVKGARPILALEITVEEVFFHCAKAFLRSDLWDPATWRPTDLPSVAEISKRLMPEVDLDTLEQRYEETSYRKLLY